MQVKIFMDENRECCFIRLVAPSRLFYAALELFRALIPDSERVYDSESKTWQIGRGGQGERGLREWLRHMEREGQAEIVYGSHREERKDARQKVRAAMAPSDAYATLHLLPSAPPELIRAARKVLSRLNHPDVGGDTQAMQRINEAYAELQKAGRVGA